MLFFKSFFFCLVDKAKLLCNKHTNITKSTFVVAKIPIVFAIAYVLIYIQTFKTTFDIQYKTI